MEIAYKPRLITTDMVALRNAALASVGVVQLPTLMVTEQLRDNTLISLLPDWTAPAEIIHAVYPSRRGQLPAVRALIDYLVERYKSFEEQ